MPSTHTSEFVLLATLIAVLKDKEYYQTFAKTIAMTYSPEKPIPSEDKVVSEMFHYFIQNNLLKIYLNNALATLETIEVEIDQRFIRSTENNNNESESMIRNGIWNNEIYIKIDELKKLYANKCIMFPNTLLKELREK